MLESFKNLLINVKKFIILLFASFYIIIIDISFILKEYKFNQVFGPISRQVKEKLKNIYLYYLSDILNYILS